MLTPQEGGDLLDGSEAAQALEGGERDGHFGLVVGVGVVLGELGVQLGRQLLPRGQRWGVTSPTVGTRGAPHPTP